MRYSICIIDNEIPSLGIETIDDFKLLNSSNLKFLLDQNIKPWKDEVVKNLTRILLDEVNADSTPKWDVYGCTDPSIYINMLTNSVFRSDIIIYDWDYPGLGKERDPESLLRDILDKSFNLVFIFSRADKDAEINTMLEKPEFKEYKGRLRLLDKEISGIDQSNFLLREVEVMYTENFSFRFASMLLKKSVQTMDKILSDLGKTSLSDIKYHIIQGDGGKKDFIDFLTERFRTAIAGKDIYNLVDNIPEPAGELTDQYKSIAAKIWSSRLYFHRETGDDLVRRGDIIKKDNEFYLILSADCDLCHFWKKNLGIINTIALHVLEANNSELIKMLTLCVKPKDILSGTHHGLLDNIGKLAEGPFILPFVPINANTKNFVAIPKDLISHRIKLPPTWNETTDKKKFDSMVYDYWSEVERICTVTEPFLTPIIQHILNNIDGNGIPDYPPIMKEILIEFLKDSVKLAEAEDKESLKEKSSSKKRKPEKDSETVKDAELLKDAEPVKDSKPEKDVEPEKEVEREKDTELVVDSEPIKNSEPVSDSKIDSEKL